MKATLILLVLALPLLAGAQDPAAQKALQSPVPLDPLVALVGNPKLGAPPGSAIKAALPEVAHRSGHAEEVVRCPQRRDCRAGLDRIAKGG